MVVSTVVFGDRGALGARVGGAVGTTGGGHQCTAVGELRVVASADFRRRGRPRAGLSGRRGLALVRVYIDVGSPIWSSLLPSSASYRSKSKLSTLSTSCTRGQIGVCWRSCGRCFQLSLLLSVDDEVQVVVRDARDRYTPPCTTPPGSSQSVSCAQLTVM